MAKKEKYAVITFHTTTGAMHMEKVAKENGAKGRLIPVPRVISAGCGLSWREPIENKRYILSLIEDNKIEMDEVYELDL